MLKVTVDRKRWYRGKSGSKLYRPEDGKMCCLGFACEAAGMPQEKYSGISAPASVAQMHGVPSSLSKLVESGAVDDSTTGWDNTAVCYNLMMTNDKQWVDEDRDIAPDGGYAEEYSDADREKRLLALGAQAGIEFEFVG